MACDRRPWRCAALVLAPLLATHLACAPFPADDGDGDGYGASFDCDDGDPAVHPGAAEACTREGSPVDEDCDGALDEGEAEGASLLVLDVDGDGHGGDRGELPPWQIRACAPQRGYAPAGGDCDDADPAVHPGAEERCDGAVDEDCDGAMDEGFDGDGDGVSLCGAPGIPADCDDADPAVHPGAEERCDGLGDEDCDGSVDESPDADGDGHPRCATDAAAADCDDGDAQVSPSAAERCTGGAPRDEDCDGAVDEGYDGDADGFSLCGDEDLPPDCADGDGAVYPGAPEDCDGRDEDCDGRADEGYPDGDGDGAASCADCDDGDPTRSPLLFDACDARDEDCDGGVDEGDVCPCPRTLYGGHTYLFCPFTADWGAAAAACAAVGYHLARIEDADENAWIAYEASLIAVVDWWVGLSDASVEGQWRWEDGEAPGFANWAPGEPNNLDDEDCVGIYPDGRWNDEDCATPWFRYVCEAP